MVKSDAHLAKKVEKKTARQDWIKKGMTAAPGRQTKTPGVPWHSCR